MHQRLWGSGIKKILRPYSYPASSFSVPGADNLDGRYKLHHAWRPNQHLCQQVREAELRGLQGTVVNGFLQGNGYIWPIGARHIIHVVLWG